MDKKSPAEEVDMKKIPTSLKRLTCGPTITFLMVRPLRVELLKVLASMVEQSVLLCYVMLFINLELDRPVAFSSRSSSDKLHSIL